MNAPWRFASTRLERAIGNSSAGSTKPASRSATNRLPPAPPPPPPRPRPPAAAPAGPLSLVTTASPWCAARASASSASHLRCFASSFTLIVCFPYVAFIVSSALLRTRAKYLCSTHAWR